MYIDFALSDMESNETAAKEIVLEAISCGINSITVPYYLIKPIRTIVPANADQPIALSCFIDYPLGISDSKTRRHAIEQAHKSGVVAIDLAMPRPLVANRKYERIREDMRICSEFCIEKNIHMRYILEYRTFDHQCLKKICDICEEYKITHIYPSTNYFIDNLADNILASIFLHQNSKDINILCTGNIWTDKHFETILKSGLFGFRTNAIHSLKNFIRFKSNHSDKNGV